MLAMLFAVRVVDGRTDFMSVPTKLKPEVARIIVNEVGLPELVPIEYR